VQGRLGTCRPHRRRRRGETVVFHSLWLEALAHKHLDSLTLPQDVLVIHSKCYKALVAMQCLVNNAATYIILSLFPFTVEGVCHSADLKRTTAASLM
jgi:hypothetical protein